MASVLVRFLNRPRCFCVGSRKGGFRLQNKKGERKISLARTSLTSLSLLTAHCLLLTAYCQLLSYGSASMMSLKRKVPSCTTPNVKFTSILALFARPPGIDTVTVEL